MQKFFTWASIKTESTKGNDLLNNVIFIVMFIDTCYLLYI